MKKLIFTLFVVLVLGFSFSSCSKDDDSFTFPTPPHTVVCYDCDYLYSYNVGEEIQFNEVSKYMHLFEQVKYDGHITITSKNILSDKIVVEGYVDVSKSWFESQIESNGRSYYNIKEVCECKDQHYWARNTEYKNNTDYNYYYIKQAVYLENDKVRLPIKFEGYHKSDFIR